MAQETVGKRVHIKRAQKEGDRRLFQTIVAQAIQALPKVGKRKEVLGEDSKHIRAITYHRTFANTLFGIFASYNQDQAQLVISEDDDADTLDIEELAPPERGKRLQFLSGICYFAIHRDHVLLAQSQSLASRQFESHIKWLVEKAGISLPPFAIADAVSTPTKQKILRSHVKQIEFGTPLVGSQDETDTVDSSSSNALVNLGSVGISVLRTWLGEENFGKLKLSDALDGNIDVSLRIRYKHTTTEKARKLLDGIAIAARNLEEGDVRIGLVGGGKITGNELKLSKMIHVPARKGIPSADELFEGMHQWLTELLRTKLVEP